MSALIASGLTINRAGLPVVREASLSVEAGTISVLLGANGAGKTTLLKVLMGLIPARGGHTRFAGADITRLRTDLRVRQGIVYMSETSGFPGLTIAENIRIGGQFVARAELKRRTAELYAVFPALAEKRNALASSLSGGQRKMLGVAKALAAGPRLLVMDEPSAGLSPLFVKEVIHVLARFREQGLSLLIAEQNVKFLELADRVYTLDGGRIGFAGTVAEMRANDAVRRAYFGLK